jgi:hypothetical protein
VSAEGASANRLSVLSDEVAPDLRGAIRFAKTFELNLDSEVRRV